MSRPHPRLTERFRKAGWLSESPQALDRWLRTKIGDRKRAYRALSPVVQEFKDLIDNDGDMYMGFNRMFENATGPVSSTSCLHFLIVLTAS